jgi:chemotaxis receptor (MCP) glutamine deamidase CheD
MNRNYIIIVIIIGACVAAYFLLNKKTDVATQNNTVLYKNPGGRSYTGKPALLALA